MMLVFSLVLGIVPLLGIAWIVVSGTAETVDGLFLALILLALSGILLLNAAWEAHTRGYLRFLRRKKPAASKDLKAQRPQPQKATGAADATKAGEAPVQTTAEAPAQKTT